MNQATFKYFQSIAILSTFNHFQSIAGSIKKCENTFAPKLSHLPGMIAARFHLTWNDYLN
jgi:hypothetical protein